MLDVRCVGLLFGVVLRDGLVGGLLALIRLMKCTHNAYYSTYVHSRILV